jgi:phosphoglycerol transferase MdoB-like AlkP superfamily enzyme
MTILIITYILNVIDYLETLYLIQHFGIAVEGNPIMRYLIENNCAWAKLVVPAILLLICGIATWKDRTYIAPIYVAFAFYLFLVIHNLSIIVQAGL